jgi:hypothetical protein
MLTVARQMAYNGRPLPRATLSRKSRGCPQAPDLAPIDQCGTPWPRRLPHAVGAKGSPVATPVTESRAPTSPAVYIGFLISLIVTLLGAQATAQRSPEGQLILGMNFTIVPALLNPSEMTGATAAIFCLRPPRGAAQALAGESLGPRLGDILDGKPGWTGL